MTLGPLGFLRDLELPSIASFIGQFDEACCWVYITLHADDFENATNSKTSPYEKVNK